jgi:hypothetical protein
MAEIGHLLEVALESVPNHAVFGGGGTGGIVVPIPRLMANHTTSCGCLQVDRAKEANTTHGCDPRGRRTPELRAWHHMRERCNNPNDSAFPYYGGRGIEVRYESFEEFLADVGPRPSSAHSIGRIDNEGHYEPGNCRWETRKQQNSNTRRNRFIEYMGKRMTVAEAAKAAGLKRSTLEQRIRQGYTDPVHLFARRLYVSKTGVLHVSASPDVEAESLSRVL